MGLGLCTGWRWLLLCLPLLIILSHLFSVTQVQQEAMVENAHKKAKNKFDHLVLGPTAGEGLPNRLQCEGVKAVSKMQFSNSARGSNIGENIAFATVFTIYNSSIGAFTNGGSSNRVTVGEKSYDKVERSMAILDAFIDFIKVTMPQSNVIILTDPASSLSLHRDRVSIYPIQGEYAREKLMLQRIKSYIAFLQRKLEEDIEDRVCHYIFTDSDIAVVDDLGKIFHDYPDFHLALTFRNNKQQPVNSGFIAIRGTTDGITRAVAFLQEVLEVYRSKYMRASRMLGDQLALAAVVTSHASFDVRRFTKAQAFTEKIKGASILFLPCAMYNWTPPEGAGQFHGMPLDVKVVHFKGSRKRLMLECWNFFNSSANISDMLCLILRSGRTKSHLSNNAVFEVLKLQGDIFSVLDL